MTRTKLAQDSPSNDPQQPLTGYRVLDLSGALGVYCGKLKADMGADLAENPQLKERGFFRQVPDSQNVLRTIEGAPYRLSLTPGGPVRGAPELGADQTYIL